MDLVNRSLSEIGKGDVSVMSSGDDIFDLGLTSIDRIVLLAKIEELSARRLDIGKLGVAPALTVGRLADCLS